MLAMRALAPLKSLQIITSRLQYGANYSIVCAAIKANRKNDGPNTNLCSQSRYLTNTHVYHAEDGLLKRTMLRIFPKSIKRDRLKYTGDLYYEQVVDQLNYPYWFRELQLSDSFHSWFVITELHVWMMMVRCMDGTKEGDILRTCIAETLWDDTNTRVKKLRSSDPLKAKEQVVLLHDQFNAAMLGYDEGLLTSDIVLAGAIWRRFFKMSCDDPLLVERLVKYIRRHVLLLENLPNDKFFGRTKIDWIPLSQI